MLDYHLMLLQSLRALCKAPGGAGSIWKYLEALVRATGVSGRFGCGFRTDLHFADVEWTWGEILTASPIALQSRCKCVLNEPIVTYGHSWPQCQSVCLKQETNRGRRTWETAIRRRYATRRVVLMPCTEDSATGVSLTALTEHVQFHAAIPPRRKCFLLMCCSCIPQRVSIDEVVSGKSFNTDISGIMLVKVRWFIATQSQWCGTFPQLAWT